MRRLLLAALLPLLAAAPAVAHTPDYPKLEVKNTAALYEAHKVLVEKAENTPFKVERNEATQGRPSDGRVIHARVYAQANRLHVAFHPGDVKRYDDHLAMHAEEAATGPANAHLASIAYCESRGNPRAYNPAGPYGGLYQFDQSTWESVGGTGWPGNATPAEQHKRAAILYAQRGPAPWPICGYK